MRPRDPTDSDRVDAMTLKDHNLRHLLMRRIAFHHAGLDSEDRKQIEEHYIKGEIRIIVSTSVSLVGLAPLISRHSRSVSIYQLER